MRASGAVRSDRIAAAAAVLTALIVLAAATALAAFVFEQPVKDVQRASRGAAGTIAQDIADDVERALQLGIPLEKMRGVDEYLGDILTANPVIDAVAIAAPDGTVVFAAPRVRPGGEKARLTLNGALAGEVVVWPRPAVVRDLRHSLFEVAGAFALLCGAAMAIGWRAWRLERLDLPQARFVASARAAARGTFADFTPPRTAPFTMLGTAAAGLIAPLRRSHRTAMALADEVRALDTAGELRAPLRAALGRLAGLRFDRPLATALQRRFSWWPIATLAAVSAARPLGASFAADRVGTGPLAALVVGSTAGAAALGALVGIATAALLAGRLARVAAFAGLCLAAAATAATFAVRDPETVLLTRFAAAFGGWLALASYPYLSGEWQRRPWRTGLVLAGGFATGPVIGALLAEAEGRRMAYATIGALILVMAAVAALGAQRTRRPVRPRLGLRASEALALLAASLLLFTWLDLHLAATLYREHYGGLALNAAVAGCATLCAFIVPVRPPASLAVLVAAAAVGASLAVPDAALGVSAVIGLAFGYALVPLGGRGFGAPALATLFAGAALAGAGAALPFFVDAPQLWVAAGAAAVLAAIAMVLR